MEYKIKFNNDIIQNTFKKALLFNTKARGDFFHDIRLSFKEEVEDLLIKQGIQVNKESFLGSTNLLSGKVKEVNPIELKKEKLDVVFCSKYGHDDYSLKAINWYSDYSELPSLLPFCKVKEFSIGNIAILVKNASYDIDIVTSDDIKLAGYSYHITPRKRKSFLCLFGVRFTYSSLKSILDKYKNCNCEQIYLDHVYINSIQYPGMFICRKCGKLYTCKCFQGYFDIDDDILRLLPGGLLSRNEDTVLRKTVTNIIIRSNICHSCTNTIPQPYYRSNSHPSVFMNHYLPYFELAYRKKFNSKRQGYLSELDDKIKRCKKETDDLISNYINEGTELQYIKESFLPAKDFSGDSYQAKIIRNSYMQFLRNMILNEIEKGISMVKSEHRKIFEKLNNAINEREEYINSFDMLTENEVRKQFNYPLIGEGWLSETTLFKIVQTLFSPKDVIHHYRGKELKGLEIDIWIPDLKLGIEYQGEQHYKVIEHWGGEEGLRKRMENDRKKRKLCKTHGYHLVEFKYNEELIEEKVTKKLMKFFS